MQRYAAPEQVRELEDDPTGYPAELWKQLAELDLIGLLVPTEYGGSGMTALEGAILYEELGRRSRRRPHFVSAVIERGRAPARRVRRAAQEWLPSDRVRRSDPDDRLDRAAPRLRPRRVR